ncbi:brix domain-containing protein 1 [Capsaspora owczarzaki ATCC 30864]|uniref:Ribosome production factor 2 homolog n=1 Tax=Capsaspora owczarzaki (strain ATCC 30864) TaxID=595528 RepID=A0A0D2VRG4_CAPO3|nr:brix domain-containing protein 1 [Capsaspora owczarzaki ATCC 30864]KJE93457.1 brix domain-containing protein 1 [Capsaspora owczarzaki ATCC 30864]|eukprot:XP_004348070.1 brix domain-containing protein 1 [Capsaspora owczarzaki ATCC 30864]
MARSGLIPKSKTNHRQKRNAMPRDPAAAFASGSSGVRKAKTRRGKRILEDRAPKIEENPKSSLFVRGGNTSEVITNCLREFSLLRKPHTINLRRKNPIHPFEDATFVESFSKKYDASLFAFGNHSKKRPHNLILGRTFDHQLLDMIEFGVQDFKSLSDFKNEKSVQGSKPCLFFAGDGFEQLPELKHVKNLLADFFRGPVVDKIALAGLDHVITFVALSDKSILLNHHRIVLKKSGTRLPRVELEEIGPSMTLEIRRTQLASDDLRRDALRVPKQLKPTKVKNIEYDSLGNKLGRVHIAQPDLAELQTRKMKGLKRSHAQADADDDDDDGVDASQPEPVQPRALPAAAAAPAHSPKRARADSDAAPAPKVASPAIKAAASPKISPRVTRSKAKVARK